jgi:hypothetical protein
MTQDILNENEHLQDEPKLSTGLNVLTIFTFIGCAFGLYSAIKDFFTGPDALEKLKSSQEKMADAPSWVKKLTGPEVQEMMAKAIENKIPMIAINLVALSLCVFGAIEMRKLKKQGYFIWLLGEVLPIIATAIFLPVFFNTVFAYALVFPLLFIILYTVQRKKLKY